MTRPGGRSRDLEEFAQELRLLKEKVRVYQLARELNVETKDLLDMCRTAGIDVKNQLSSLDPDQRDAVEQMVRRGGGTAVAAPPKPAGGVLPTPPSRMPNLSSTRPPVIQSKPAVRREPEPEPLAQPLPAPPV